MPNSVAAPSLENQEYTITQDPVTYTVPVFTADPAWCAITYTYTITDSNGNNVVIATFSPLSFDDIARLFTIDYETDLDFSGPTSKSYTIEVTGTAGNVSPTSDSSSFDLTIKNPCIDPNFVTIEEKTLLD